MSGLCSTSSGSIWGVKPVWSTSVGSLSSSPFSYWRRNMAVQTVGSGTETVLKCTTYNHTKFPIFVQHDYRVTILVRENLLLT